MEGPFQDPAIPHGERTAYRGLVGGEEAGAGVLVVEHTTVGRHEAYRQRVDIAARGSEYEAALTFRRRDGSIHAEDYALETRQGDAAPIAAEQGRFRQVKPLGWGAEPAPYPRDLVPILGCAVALRGLEFADRAQRMFSVWLANTIHWEVEATVERTESIALPIGRVDARPVRLRPSLEQVDRTLDRLVGGLMPPVVMHFAAAAPHRFLRLEFPTGPFRWNPPGVIEATALDDDVADGG